MTAKRRRFVELYLTSLNATEAYKGAYGVTNDNTAAVNGSKLLRDAKVKAEIAKGQAERTERTKVDADYVVANLTEVVERCMQRAPVMVFDRAERCMVQAQQDGKDLWTFDAHGAVKALTLLAKHTGGFRDQTDHRFPDGFPAGVLAVPVPVTSEQWGHAAAAQQAQLLAHPPKSQPLVS